MLNQLKVILLENSLKNSIDKYVMIKEKGVATVPRQKSGEFNKKEYDLQYMKDNIKRRLLPFNMNKPEDKVLWDWLDKVDNITEYIKRLIKDDMAKGEKTMYNVALSNRETIFDSAEFNTQEEVIEFSKGRGGVYVVQIGTDTNKMGISVSYDSDKDIFSRFDGWDWEIVSEDEVKKMISAL